MEVHQHRRVNGVQREGRGTEVHQVTWPIEDTRLADLRRSGQPMLLLVDCGTQPPVCESPLEDWTWQSSPPSEVIARTEALRRAAERFVAPPRLDDDGVLAFRGRRATFPPTEARLMRELLTAYGSVVSREHLTRAAWGNPAPGRNALDVHILRIRRRLEPVSLRVRTVRSRGYLLEAGLA